MIHKQDPKKKKQGVKKKVYQEEDVRLKVRKPQPKEKYKHKNHWMEEEEE